LGDLDDAVKTTSETEQAMTAYLGDDDDDEQSYTELFTDVRTCPELLL
jgi:hypothetical protein